MNHRRLGSRTRSKTKVKRSPKTKQKSLKRKSPGTKLRSSVKRKSPGMKLRSFKRKSLRMKLMSVKVRKLSPKMITTNKDDGKKIKSRRKKEVHYQRPLVPNYKIIRNRNTSYYEKREEEEEQFYPSFSSYPMNSYNNISATVMQKLSSTNDNIKNAPLSSFAALDDDKVINNKVVNKNVKRNDNHGKRNTRSRTSFKHNNKPNLKPMKLILTEEDVKIIKSKILKDYKNGKFKDYNELPENLKLKLSEKKYYKMIDKIEQKYSVPPVEPDETRDDEEIDETRDDEEPDDKNNVVNEPSTEESDLTNNDEPVGTPPNLSTSGENII